MRALHPPHQRMGCRDSAWRGVDCLLVIGSFADTQKKISRQCPHVFAFYNHPSPLRGTTATTQKTISTLMRNLTTFPMRAALLLLAVLVTDFVFAHDFKEDDIYYKYVGNDVYVTYRGDQIRSYDGEYSGEIVIPETVTHNNVTYKVAGVYQYAFFMCPDLVKVTMGNSIKEIQYQAFACSGIAEVGFGNSLETIGDGAFRSCDNLNSITLPNSVTILGKNDQYGNLA